MNNSVTETVSMNEIQFAYRQPREIGYKVGETGTFWTGFGMVGVIVFTILRKKIMQAGVVERYTQRT